MGRICFLAIAFGLFMLGMAGYNYYKAMDGLGGLPPKEELLRVEGRVTRVERQELTRTGRRGRQLHAGYQYVLTVKLVDGGRQNITMGQTVGMLNANKLQGKSIVAFVHPENFRAYDLVEGGRQIINYDTEVKEAQARAETARDESLKPENLLLGLGSLLLGLALWFGMRWLGNREQETQSDQMASS